MSADAPATPYPTTPYPTTPVPSQPLANCDRDPWEDLFGEQEIMPRGFLRVLIRGSQGPVRLDIPVVNKLETFDIAAWAMTSGANYIALSSVQCPEDVIECRSHYRDPIKLVSMIELTWNFEVARFNSVCFENFDAILQESDGIVITHSGIDMEIQDVLLQKAKTAGKMAICADDRAEHAITMARLC